MPKRGRHPRGGGRVTPRVTRPLSAGARPTGPGLSGPAFGAGSGSFSAGAAGPSLIADVRRALRAFTPLDMLMLVSGVLAAVDERRHGPPGQSAELSLDMLVRSFAEVDGPETTALLAVIAELSDDEVAQERARRELAVRGGRLQRLPDWVRRLGDSASLLGAEMTHALGDGENVLLEVRVPPRHTLSVVVYIDHNLGTIVQEAFVVPEAVGPLAKLMRGDDPDMTWRPIWIGDAGARVAEAVERWAMTYPRTETDTWPVCRPFVDWVLRRLVPDGGKGYERPQWTAAERAELARRFLASSFGARHRSAGRRKVLDALLLFGTDHGPGDPLRWSPVAVEVLLMDWLHSKVVAPPGKVRDAPDVLRDLIRFSHAERGIRPVLTQETLAAVEEWADWGRFRARRSETPESMAARILDPLAEEVGGRDELMALDDTPLPDEDVAWDRVASDVRPRVREIADLCDRWCEEVVGARASAGRAARGAGLGASAGEYRTACRRFLTAVAAADPALFRRRAKVESMAAAVCWAVGSANHLFDPWHGGLLVKDLAAYFGISGNPSARGRTFLAVTGFDTSDGYDPVRLDARYLVSSYRRSLITRAAPYLPNA